MHWGRQTPVKPCAPPLAYSTNPVGWRLLVSAPKGSPPNLPYPGCLLLQSPPPSPLVTQAHDAILAPRLASGRRFTFLLFPWFLSLHQHCFLWCWGRGEGADERAPIAFPSYTEGTELWFAVFLGCLPLDILDFFPLVTWGWVGGGSCTITISI